MPLQIFSMVKEIDELTLIAEETLAQIQLKVEELKKMYQEYQEQLPNPAFLGDPSSRRQPQK